jgi:hypothetical protein
MRTRDRILAKLSAIQGCLDVNQADQKKLKVTLRFETSKMDNLKAEKQSLLNQQIILGLHLRAFPLR